MRPVPSQGHRDPESKHHGLHVCWEALLYTPSILSGARVQPHDSQMEVSSPSSPLSPPPTMPACELSRIEAVLGPGAETTQAPLFL